MPRNPSWEALKPEIYAKLASEYPIYSRDANVQDFPRHCPHPEQLTMRGQKWNYSCSYEMAVLALKIQGLSGISEREICEAIKLTIEGSDPWNLFRGLCMLGVDCMAREGGTTSELVGKLATRNAIYICDVQQPAYSTKREILDTAAGHYMAACCDDKKYVYFADPGYPEGKTRIQQKHLDLLWHDIELATGRMIYGFMIEVPFVQ